MNITETVINIIKEQLSLGENTALSEATHFTELDADSLDVVEIVMAIEDEFSVEISDEAVEAVRTVGDVVKVISELTE